MKLLSLCFVFTLSFALQNVTSTDIEDDKTKVTNLTKELYVFMEKNFKEIASKVYELREMFTTNTEFQNVDSEISERLGEIAKEVNETEKKIEDEFWNYWQEYSKNVFDRALFQNIQFDEECGTVTECHDEIPKKYRNEEKKPKSVSLFTGEYEMIESVVSKQKDNKMDKYLQKFQKKVSPILSKYLDVLVNQTKKIAGEVFQVFEDANTSIDLTEEKKLYDEILGLYKTQKTQLYGKISGVLGKIESKDAKKEIIEMYSHYKTHESEHFVLKDESLKTLSGGLDKIFEDVFGRPPNINNKKNIPLFLAISFAIGNLLFGAM